MSEKYDFVRADVILDELSSTGHVMVQDLADRLGVSAVTIRKDLDALEERSLLRRVRGGAVVAAGKDEGAFTDRMRRDANVKRAIAREVGTLVDDGDVIAIDSSTTSFYLAQELVHKDDLTVVTFGMRTAMEFLERSNATIVLPGGVVRRESGGMVGAISNILEGRGRIQKGFFGTASLSTALGMLEISSDEAATKRALVAACDVIHVSVASSKIDTFGLHPFAGPDEVDRIFTDEHAPDGFVENWSALGVPVTRVPGTGALIEAKDRLIDAGNATTARP